MALYLKLDEEVIQNVTAVIVGQTYRNETKVTTFSGGTTVDRGLLKFKVTATISEADVPTFAKLHELMDRIILKAEFYYNGGIQTANVVTTALDSYSYSYQNEDETSPSYSDITLTLEEE